MMERGTLIPASQRGQQISQQQNIGQTPFGSAPAPSIFGSMPSPRKMQPGGLQFQNRFQKLGSLSGTL
ncbi:hypothetical protein WR25_12426 [Diploscapter pachys]|uniref:Uncharacterized protein n=1 Tax=Diploscapter pachys TaxID=2018661 RepID=A0A2A2J4F1_9BILA|nr:hypothetical protein WR25_12426 [Diploscapter pachys]